VIRYGQPAPRMGDIGDNPREYEFEPLTTPATEPITVPTPEPAAPEPVAPEPVPAGACIEWQNCIDPDGYGRKRVGAKMERAHRIAWQEKHGPIPAGMVTDHLCRNRRCVNVAHLELVTHRENTLRGHGPTARNARATSCINGHEFTPANTRIRPNDGSRVCRACARAREAAYRAARREAAAA
jgi:hypothetical protein